MFFDCHCSFCFTGPALKRRAFTLIELLVVISIISLLVAMLLPALRTARVSAYVAASLSNARQITTALHAYATDSMDSMPYLSEASPPAMTQFKRNATWAKTLYDRSYVSAIDVYWSPGKVRTGSETFLFEAVGYGLNGVDHSSSTSGTVYDGGVSVPQNRHVNGQVGPPMKIGGGGAPPPTMMLMLAETFGGQTYGAPCGSYIASPGANVSNYGGLFNYDRRIVRSYVDGHAKAPEGMSGVYITDTLSQVGDVTSRGEVKVAPDPDLLGWNQDRESLVGGTGSYSGDWTVYQSIHPVYPPCFSKWRSDGWHRELQ